ncbi:MAG: cytochrome c3 family protein [Desulfobacterales bacterium]
MNNQGCDWKVPQDQDGYSVREVEMTRVFSAIILAFFIGICLIGCGGVDDYRPGEQAEIPANKYSITFGGGSRGDVTFTHDKHAREYYGNACITCHDHEDVGGETRWYCGECHTAKDSEGRCNEDSEHGCIMTQCQSCHEAEGPPAPIGGSFCWDCHPY